MFLRHQTVTFRSDPFVNDTLCDPSVPLSLNEIPFSFVVLQEKGNDDNDIQVPSLAAILSRSLFLRTPFCYLLSERFFDLKIFVTLKPVNARLK